MAVGMVGGALAAVAALVLAFAPTQTHGHGRLIEPPSRASAWRYGFSTPPNYNDHELYCGGFSRQWQRNGGKCGVCGDAWDLPAPRPHEFGGTYGQGVVVRRYARGQTVTLRVELTANHNGYFEFRLCDAYADVTQNCLDRHVLSLATASALGRRRATTSTTTTTTSGDDTRFYPRDGNRIYEMRYRLPEHVTCPHCLLQWRYTAGNNWGDCPNGTAMVGCGPQEEFRACSDIAIEGKHASPTSTEGVPGIPGVSTASPPSVPAPSTYSPLAALIVAISSFLAAVVLLAVVYVHYYQVARRVKSFLKGGAPVPPPRVKRRAPDIPTFALQQKSADAESIA